MQKPKFYDAKEAIIHAIEEIKRKEKVLKYKIIEGDKGIIGAYITTDRNKYLCKFQKSFYKSFQYLEDGKTVKAQGVSFRSDQLYNCYDDYTFPMIVLKDGRLFFTSASKWLDWCIKRHNKLSTVIVRPEDRKDKVDRFTYYNIDLDMLQEF